MCRRLSEPANIEAIIKKSGNLWSAGEIDTVQIWLNVEPQLHCMLFFTACNLGNVATSQDVEDSWSRFNFRELASGEVSSYFRDNVIRNYISTKGNFIGWLKGGLNLFCRDEQRRFLKLTSKEEDIEPHEPHLQDKSLLNDPLFEIEESDNEQVIALKDCIEKLPEKYQIIIMLFYFNDMSVKDIATKLDLGVSNVKTKLYLSRQKLADCLKENLVGD